MRSNYRGYYIARVVCDRQHSLSIVPCCGATRTHAHVCAAKPLVDSANQQAIAHTWLAYVRWNALLSWFRSLNWSRPTSPSAATVSCADSAGMMSCTHDAPNTWILQTAMGNQREEGNSRSSHTLKHANQPSTLSPAPAPWAPSAIGLCAGIRNPAAYPFLLPVRADACCDGLSA